MLMKSLFFRAFLGWHQRSTGLMFIFNDLNGSQEGKCRGLLSHSNSILVKTDPATPPQRNLL